MGATLHPVFPADHFLILLDDNKRMDISTKFNAQALFIGDKKVYAPHPKSASYKFRGETYRNNYAQASLNIFVGVFFSEGDGLEELVSKLKEVSASVNWYTELSKVAAGERAATLSIQEVLANWFERNAPAMTKAKSGCKWRATQDMEGYTYHEDTVSMEPIEGGMYDAWYLSGRLLECALSGSELAINTVFGILTSSNRSDVGELIFRCILLEKKAVRTVQELLYNGLVNGVNDPAFRIHMIEEGMPVDEFGYSYHPLTDTHERDGDTMINNYGLASMVLEVLVTGDGDVPKSTEFFRGLLLAENPTLNFPHLLELAKSGDKGVIRLLQSTAAEGFTKLAKEGKKMM